MAEVSLPSNIQFSVKVWCVHRVDRGAQFGLNKTCEVLMAMETIQGFGSSLCESNLKKTAAQQEMK